MTSRKRRAPVNKDLTTKQMLEIVEQALVIVEQVYVHLPLKRAMHAVEPIQRLKLLRQRLALLSERAFHDEMISIFAHLRDLHTNYILPDPFRDRVAYVPFRIQDYFDDDGQRHYVVTQVTPGAVNPNSADKYFKRGVLVTHWNGIPIDRAVQMNAEREAGSNLEARRARGLEAMTIRPMALSLPPDEEWVVVSYKTSERARVREIRFDWEVLALDPTLEGVDPLSATGEAARMLGIDARSDLERRTRKKLFAPEAIAVERRVAADPLTAQASGGAVGSSDIDYTKVSTMPRVFEFREVKTKHGHFGYIRIRTFNVPSDEGFVNEFIRIAALLPQNGLIIDVRGNGGGLISAGERLLQLLTPHRIDAQRLHFLNTSLTLKLCQHNDFIQQWRDSIAQAVETGATYSQGFSLLPPDRYNDIGQKYQGPIVLLIDALCYSTTDIFTAGFQDHEIGVVLGTSANTGAGGANVWGLDLLQQCLPGRNTPFKTMPKNVSFRVAIRHTTRVGKRSGVLVEDLGIVPDEIHPITRNDVLKNSVDVIEDATKILAKKTVYALSAKVENAVPRRVVITSMNITRVDPIVNDRPYTSVDVQGGTAEFDLPPLPLATNLLELRGFHSGQLKVSTRLAV